MNYDPIRKCWQCQLPKLRDTFRALPGTKPKREVCESCYAVTMAARLKIRQAAMKKDSVPF